MYAYNSAKYDNRKCAKYYSTRVTFRRIAIIRRSLQNGRV